MRVFPPVISSERNKSRNLPLSRGFHYPFLPYFEQRRKARRRESKNYGSINIFMHRQPNLFLRCCCQHNRCTVERVLLLSSVVVAALGSHILLAVGAAIRLRENRRERFRDYAVSRHREKRRKRLANVPYRG